MARALTPSSRDLVERMGQRATVMWRAAASAYLERDRTMAERLRRWDDDLDDLHVTLTVELATTALPVANTMASGRVSTATPASAAIRSRQWEVPVRALRFSQTSV